MKALPAAPLSLKAVGFGQELVLERAELLGVEAGSTANTMRAGELLGATTHRQVREQLPRLKFSLRLVDPAGMARMAEDWVPQTGYAPTEGWQPGLPRPSLVAGTAPFVTTTTLPA